MPVKKKGSPKATAREKLLLRAFNAIRIGAFIAVPLGDQEIIALVNRKLEEMFGLSAKDMEGKDFWTFWETILPRLDGAPRVRDDLHRLLSNEHEIREDYLRTEGERPMLVERFTAPLMNRVGNRIGRVWTFREASREFSFKVELLRQRQRVGAVRQILDFLLEASFDPDNIAELNHLLCRGLDLAGVAFVELKESGFGTVVQYPDTLPLPFPIDSEESLPFFRKRRKGRARHFERSELPGAMRAQCDQSGIVRVMLLPLACCERRSGYFVLQVSKKERTWNAEDAREGQLMADAVSVWWQKEELRGRMMAERTRAESASRARGDFMALISHELRTPLNPLVGFTQLLEEKADELSSDNRDMVSRIAEGARRLQNLVEDLLTLTRLDSRLEGWRRYHCDAKGIVEEGARWAGKLSAQRNVSVALGDFSSLCVVEVDGAALRRALRALLSNAVRFTPEGGTVHLQSAIRDGQLQIRVADQGPGVPDDQKKRIFEPFVQGEPVLTRRFGGAGIGLTLVRKVAESHDGLVWVEDSPSGGAEFVLELPLAFVDPDSGDVQ